MIRRRDLLSTAAALVGTGRLSQRAEAAAHPSGTASHDEHTARRDERVTFVEADPDAGFNYPYFLATPEEFRNAPVPLLIEMNNADEEISFEKEKRGARSQVTRLEYQGAWLSEALGVPHLKPVFHEPDGDPVDASHQISELDRESMLLDETDLERVDRQFLRMADHAREVRLSDYSMHDELLIYGNSSEGTVAELMAAMHPEEFRAAVGGGMNAIVMLPLEELGHHVLEYPVGIADFEKILGKEYDREAHSAVDKFYFEGAQDPKNRLPMEDAAVGPGAQLWNDVEVYETARAVYGRDKVEDRFPRCHIAFAKAGVDAQFRVYPEMTHNPRPASHDIRDFFEKSLAGEDVSEFGQSFELSLDREPIVVSRKDTSHGIDIEFAVSGRWPPPEGLVTYSWAFGEGGTATGQRVTHTYDGPGSYEVTLSMQTAHGQRAEATSQLTFFDVSNVEWSSSELFPGERVTASAEVRNPATDSQTVQVAIQRLVGGSREAIHAKEVSFDPEESKTVTVEGPLRTPGEYVLSVAGQPVSDAVTVLGDPDEPISFVTELPDASILVGTTVPIAVTVVFADIESQGTFRFPILLDGRVVERGSAELKRFSSKTITFQYPFEAPGEHELTAEVAGEDRHLKTIVVEPESTPSPSPSPTPSETPTVTTAEPTDQTTAPGQPGFGVLSALAGIGSAMSYLLFRDESE